jgi:hypothetical protein
MIFTASDWLQPRASRALVIRVPRAKGWDIAWGRQLDTRIVRLPAGGEPNIAVASYLAKYATKSTEASAP